MSVETDERGAAGPAEPDHEAHQHAHPSDRNYIVVAVLLAAITALEVGTYFLEDPSTTLLVVALFPLMIAKFAVVCGWFMHLRYDARPLTTLFLGPLLIATLLAVALMTLTGAFLIFGR